MVFQGDSLVADLATSDTQTIIAHGGSGGFGNAHFISSTRQLPKVAEVGERGEEFELQLELKLLADVGLIGLPNAGKSTFLSVVTNARPEIADYPFTTLTPNLGVAAVDEASLLIADIPGLIEGASQGKGLGDDFLRHVERTAVLVHLIDVYNDDVAAVYQTIRHELEAYNTTLTARQEIVALTKTEHLEPELLQEKERALRAVVAAQTPVLAISSLTRNGVQELLRLAWQAVSHVRQAELEEDASEPTESGVPVIELSTGEKRRLWQVQKETDRFLITGPKIERFAARTDFNNEDGLRRLRDIMRKMGVMHELERQGIQPGDKIVIGRTFGHSMEY
jgi:GTP-binding protein